MDLLKEKVDNLELQIEEITIRHDVSKFKCSNTSINTYLKSDAYYENIMKFANTKIVTFNGKIAAYYTLQFDNIEIREDEFEATYPTIHLKYLAVDETFEQMGIGTTLIEHITIECEKISKVIGCRCLLIHALKDKVEWYRDRGFQYIDEEHNMDIYDTTVPMFIDFRDSQLIIDYFEEV